MTNFPISFLTFFSVSAGELTWCLEQSWGWNTGNLPFAWFQGRTCFCWCTVTRINNTAPPRLVSSPQFTDWSWQGQNVVEVHPDLKTPPPPDLQQGFHETLEQKRQSWESKWRCLPLEEPGTYLHAKVRLHLFWHSQVEIGVLPVYLDGKHSPP
jgi:hypothetical protein